MFLLILMAIFDLGRGVWMYNGLSEAAREIARTTSVHPGNPLGTSTDTLDTINVQKRLVPAMATPTFQCTDVTGFVYAPPHVPCTQDGDYVRVTVTATYKPISLLGFLGPINMSSSSSVAVP